MKEEVVDLVHQLNTNFVCATDSRGFATPGDRDLTHIVVDASEGFVPLWASGQTLRWRFQQRSFALHANPEERKRVVLDLMSQALVKWGDAAPVKFTRDDDLWDFEVVLRNAPDCSAGGCVLASAFFPDQGRHKLVIYPTMFEQSVEEQVETLIHEFGHVFGLRHFFAAIKETAWPSQVFGTHSPFSIMNYGANSMLTEADLRDLTELYRLVWSGQLPHINGTPVRLVRPYSTLASPCGQDALAALPTGGDSGSAVAVAAAY